MVAAAKVTRPVKPQFKTAEAEEFWDRTMSGEESILREEDTFLLILACDAWAEYKKCYEEFEETRDPKLVGNLCKWFDRVYKLLVALGMTPFQRRKLGGRAADDEDPASVVERRPGGSLDDEDD